MTLQQGVNAQVLDARCAPRLRTVAGWITLATVAVAVWTVPASARFAPFGGAPFDQAAIDSAMAEPDLVYAPALPCPGPAYSTLQYIGTSHCVLRPAQAFYFLALTTYLDPRATASNGQLVRQRVVDLFNTLTSDVNGPLVARPLDGWSDGPTAQAILLIANPLQMFNAIFDRLHVAEHHRGARF